MDVTLKKLYVGPHVICDIVNHGSVTDSEPSFIISVRFFGV